MYTEYFGPVNREDLGCSSAKLESAARKLQQGGLVAFPSETVYGLGATVLNEGALKRLYQVKERPQDRSLSVHIANFSQLQFVAADIPLEAHALAKEFLPGPLTLILKKSPNLSSLITGGKKTIAVRISSDPIARRLIELTGCPLAAPSANQSGKPSPTRASHVLEDFNGKIEGLVDGGQTRFGMESTLISLEDPACPTLYRFGVIPQKEIERVLNRKVPVHPLALVLNGNSNLTKMRSAVRLFSSWEEMKIYLKLSSKSKRLIMSDEPSLVSDGVHFQLKSTNLYEGLRIAERDGYAEVLVLCTPKLKQNILLLNRLKQIART
ncbi:L-threonylcarbamoyladenylate synthase [Candidatus Neptunichlamydia sp. REUL1]|uniref:L-threonylcarbamoyladenylate synthase n=1 Tax=Candidatus Neptunichlamydia sp. REUL1 TaxID=3064277 RepID=UPI0029318807|nr:L-threonylcarbamoyladenylate synthase [Candidatus Neptunochlamydia sp. REUL1]